MKQIGQLMEELGFNKDGSDEVKKAFVKHLISEVSQQNATAQVYDLSSKKSKAALAGSHISDTRFAKKKHTTAMVQMSFNLDEDKKLA
ncbi:MAG: hypothetical protein AB8E15_03300 [Bdellovibrionales bacterium]